jgi:hypothetical protein
MVDSEPDVGGDGLGVSRVSILDEMEFLEVLRVGQHFDHLVAHILR